MTEPKYIQLTSWEELIEWLEKEGKKIYRYEPPPKKKRKKKAPPQREGLF